MLYFTCKNFINRKLCYDGMKTTTTFIVIVLALAMLFVSACAPKAAPQPETTSSQPETPAAQPKVTAAPAETPVTAEPAPVESKNVVQITSSGFSPRIIKIKPGEAVTFKNTDTNPHWPASALHPTHKTYPGSDIDKCGTAEEKNTFDACHGLAEGETFTFTFSNKGEWAFHDHLHPGFSGSVVVLER